MSILNWFRRHPAPEQPQRQEPPTPPIDYAGLREMTIGTKDDVKIFRTGEELKAHLRETCKAIHFMIPGIRFLNIKKTDGKFTYEVYKGKSEEVALQFLRSIPSDHIPSLYYVMVETPMRTLGRDNRGLFDEETGQQLT